jgi:hypothetical protein
MKLSVLVITARERPGFTDLVRSLQKESALLASASSVNEVELIYVDRLWESRGGLYEKAMAQIPEIGFIHVKDEPKQQGPCPAGARNAGVRVAVEGHADWIVSIDDLTVFYEGSLLRHIELCREGLDAVVCTFDTINDLEEVIDAENADSRMGDSARSDGVWAANHFYGMHMAFAPAAWARVGGFDECFDGVYGQEDCDFGLRLWRAGCSVAWAETTKVLCYRGSNHTSTHRALFTDPSHVPTAYAAGVPKWRNDALIQWNAVVGNVVANRGEQNE